MKSYQIIKRMKSYQILVIIGAIFGMPIMIVDLLFTSYLFSLFGPIRPGLSIELIIVGYLLLFVTYGLILYGLIALKIALYVAALTVAFGSKNLSFVGIFLIICSVEILIHPPEYGSFGFPLLLAAGILALRKSDFEKWTKITITLVSVAISLTVGLISFNFAFGDVISVLLSQIM